MMPRKQRYHVTFAVVSAVAVLGSGVLCRAAGDEPPVSAVPSPLTLDQALRLALRSNKNIRVAVVAADQARAAIGAARGEFDTTLFVDASGGRSDEPVASVPVSGSENEDVAASLGVRKRAATGTEIELSTSLDYARREPTLDVLDPKYATDLSLLLKQDLLRGAGVGVNRTEILVLQNVSHMADESLRAQVMLDLFEVERTYWELSFAIADLGVRSKQLARARELVRIAEARVNVGDAAPIEITRAQSSAANQDVAIVVAGNRITRLRHELLQRMGILAMAHADDAFDLADLPGTNAVPVSIAETMKIAGALRPELAQMRWLRENAACRERFAKNQKLPSLQLYGEMSLLDLGGEFDSDAMVPAAHDYYAWEVGVMLELPLLNQAAKSNYRVARLERERLDLRAAALVETITREAADAIQEVNTAQARMASARKAHALSRRLLQAEEKSFTLGRAESFSVLDAQAALAASERDEVRARSDYAIAVAHLYRVRGDLLKVKGIAFTAFIE
jgi:outer membrane protein TolC